MFKREKTQRLALSLRIMNPWMQPVKVKPQKTAVFQYISTIFVNFP